MKKHSAVTILKISSVCFGFLAAASGISLLCCVAANYSTHMAEAIVINDDEDFSKAIDFNEEIVPGGETVQQIKVKSTAINAVKCSFCFRPMNESECDYSYLTYQIEGTDSSEAVSGNLEEALTQETYFTFSLKHNETKEITITYSLDFSYESSEESEFAFSLLFTAKGSLA